MGCDGVVVVVRVCVCVSPSLPVLRQLFVCTPQSQHVVLCQSLPVPSPSFDETIRFGVLVWPEWPEGYSSQVLLCVNREVCVLAVKGWVVGLCLT